MRIKTVEVEYIESGTFQGGEEDTSKAGIAHGEDCLVVSAKHARLVKAAPDLLAACEYALQILPQGNCGTEELRAAIKKATKP